MALIQYNRFPGGRRRALTFSYDDGPANDVPLIALFNRRGLKGTFHLNGGRYREMDEAALASVRSLYEGHEISCHTVHHGMLNHMTSISMLRETIEDRLILEKIAGYPVVGMSYPNGGWDESVMRALRECGIVYSRTTRAAMGSIDLPDNFLAWHPSCHHRDALPLARDFMDTLDSEWKRPLLYIWGHSYEFRTDADWRYMEELTELLSGDDRVWYATNIDLYNYTMAQRSLRISADESILYNPSGLSVWVERDKKEVFEIPAGQTLCLK